MNGILTISGLAAGLAHNGLAIVLMITGSLIVMIISSLRLTYGTDRPDLRRVIRDICVTLCMTAAAFLYGYWTEVRNVSAIPESMDGEQVTMQGKIASPVKVDGDRVSFELHVYELHAPAMAYQAELDERVQTTIYLASEMEQQAAEGWYRGIELRLSGKLQRPGMARNFGDFDYRNYLHHQRIHWQMTVEGMQVVEMRSRPANSITLWLGYVDQLRERLTKLVWTIYDEKYAGFMLGLLIGDQQDLPQELYDKFSEIGMTHVLAISGLHVSVFMAGCFWLLRLCRLTKERTYIVCMVLVPLYVLSTGASPSAIRAGIMAMLGLLALRMGRWKDSLRYIMIAAIVMLVWDPYHLYQVSFQLSYAVTLGLILLVPRMAVALPVRPAPVAVALSVTIVAQLCSFPFVIYYFHILHVLSPVANLLFVPLVSVLILPLGMLSLLLGAWYSALGQLPATAASYVTEWLYRAVAWTADQESLLMTWPRVPYWWIAVYYMLLIALFIWLPSLKRMFGARVMQLGLVLACAWMISLFIYGYAGAHGHRDGIVSLLDVGQGDAILIRTPHGRHILVDGGGTFRYGEAAAWRRRKDPYEVGKDTIVPLLRRRGIHRLDAVIATHMDADHIGGLHAVIEQIPVERILYNGTTKESSYVERLRLAADRRNVPMIPVYQGMRWLVDQDTTLTFLHPVHDDVEGMATQDKEESDQNRASVVFLLTVLDSQFLLTGDIGSAEEKRILSHMKNGGREALFTDRRDSIDMLKIAHHGSRYSSSAEWLQYWRPVTASISVGRNHYGHPAQDVLDRLEEVGIDMYRTDLHGEIQYLVEGDRLWLRTKLHPER